MSTQLELPAGLQIITPYNSYNTNTAAKIRFCAGQVHQSLVCNFRSVRATVILMALAVADATVWM